MTRKSLVSESLGIRNEIWTVGIPGFRYTYQETLGSSGRFINCMESLYLILGPIVLSFGWTRYADHPWWQGEWNRVRYGWKCPTDAARQYDFFGFLSVGWAIISKKA